MSTKGHDSHDHNAVPFHETVTFEPRDINASTVAKQLVYLAITIVVALAICVPVVSFLGKAAAQGDTPMPAVRMTMPMDDCNGGAFPPEPRLQGVPCHETDPQQDLRAKVAEDEAANESTAWVDKANGVAKISVHDAEKLFIEKAGAAAPQEKK